MSQVEEPNPLRTCGFGDCGHYFKWPKVADAMIEAGLSHRYLRRILLRQNVHITPTHQSPYLVLPSFPFRCYSQADNTFQWLIRQFEERMIILSDTGFHATEGDPSNLKLCQRGEWQDRMLVETVLSMLTVVCHFKRVMHRVWAYFHARLAFTMAAFNVLVQWQGFQPYASGFVPLSMAEFSL